MTEPRIIKKYKKRTLYDTHSKEWVTLADLKQLVMSGVRFEVREAKSEIDRTRETLLQILMEQEGLAEGLFSTEVLTYFIRMNESGGRSLYADYLEQSAKFFQKAVREWKSNNKDWFRGWVRHETARKDAWDDYRDGLVGLLSASLPRKKNK